MVSVIPKGGCRNVENAVEGARAVEGFQWIRAFGIIDGDGYPAGYVQNKRIKGVYALPLYSVESIYYHPMVIKCVAERQAGVTGRDASDLTAKAHEAAIEAIRGDVGRLIQNVVKKLVWKSFIEQLPRDDDILGGESIVLENKAGAILRERRNELDNAVANCDWESILRMCSVRNTGSLDRIAKALGFPNKGLYEEAVLQLLRTDEGAVESVRNLFGDLFDRLSGTQGT